MLVEHFARNSSILSPPLYSLRMLRQMHGDALPLTIDVARVDAVVMETNAIDVAGRALRDDREPGVAEVG